MKKQTVKKKSQADHIKF